MARYLKSEQVSSHQLENSLQEQRQVDNYCMEILSIKFQNIYNNHYLTRTLIIISWRIRNKMGSCQRTVYSMF
jgi:hypothetical protein